MKPSKFYLFSFLLILILLTSDVKGEANTPPSSSNNRASSSGSGAQSTASSSTQTQASTTIDTTSSTSPSVSEPSNTTNSKILQESEKQIFYLFSKNNRVSFCVILLKIV
ncbi:hypothetical protein [Lactococcus lactis]|uniref:hypothetical protein n=1 Tax=Lactococcus lactis TaxID=1358 RepID=UPI003A7FA3C4